MNSRKAIPLVVAAIVLAGGILVNLRLYVRHQQQMGGGDALYRLTYAVKFHAERTGARVQVALPADTPQSRLFRQDVLYSGLTSERLRPSRLQTRELSLIAMHPGDYTVTARLDIHVSPEAHWPAAEPDAAVTPEARARWLRGAPTIQVAAPAVVETLRRLRQEPLPGGPRELAQRLLDYCADEIARGDETAPQDAAGALEQKVATPLGRVRALIALCRAGNIPARLVTGLRIKEAPKIAPHTWVEALAGDRWEPLDPEHRPAFEMPYGFVPVRRDGLEIVRARSVTGLGSTFSIVRLPPGPGYGGSARRDPMAILDLTRLPMEMHDVLSLILLLPLGALVTSVFRTIVGVRTFGTFTPTLIALSFIFNDWRTGVLVFGAVVVLGLAGRTLLDWLRLLLVPRLSVVLTLVVLCIVFTVSLLDYLKYTPSTQAVLLPMVILTMMIERFYITTEEDGPGFALLLMSGTVLVAFCCYLVLSWGEVGRMLLAFPEIHLFTIAALILIGRYTGYRLTELWRFRYFGQPGE
jgi:hypothetical protein